MRSTIGLLIIGWVLAGEPAAAQTKTFNRTVPLSTGGGLTLQAAKGSVRLTAWDRDEVEIRARIEADSGGLTEYARRVVEETTVEVWSAGNSVTIRSNYSRLPSPHWFFSWFAGPPNIHYEIRAPRRIDLRLEIDRSQTFVAGFEGRMVMELDRSEVEGSDLTGDLRINLDRGGNSSFRNVRGSINLIAERTNLRIGVVRLDRSSRIEIDRGDVDVTVAPGQGFDLSTSLSRRADFDTNVSLPARNRDRKNMRTSLNGGGPRLAIDADRSHVRLRS